MRSAALLLALTLPAPALANTVADCTAFLSQTEATAARVATGPKGCIFTDVAFDDGRTAWSADRVFLAGEITAWPDRLPSLLFADIRSLRIAPSARPDAAGPDMNVGFEAVLKDGRLEIPSFRVDGGSAGSIEMEVILDGMPSEIAGDGTAFAGARIEALSLSATLDGLLAGLAIPRPKVPGLAGAGPDASALAAFLGALPDPDGSLSVELNGDGLAVPTLAAASLSPASLERFLSSDGVRIDWDPAR